MAVSSPTHRAESGAQAESSMDLEVEIRSANEEFGHRVGAAVELPLTVLEEQRNRALKLAYAARQEAKQQQAAMLEEQDRFIAFLMSDYERQLAELQARLQRADEQIERERKIRASVPPPSPALVDFDAPTEVAIPRSRAQVASLRATLKDAYGELDTTRQEVARLEKQLEQARTDSEDLRFEFHKELEAVQDEVVQLRWQLDESHRRLEDARDEAREEAFRLTEELDEARRDADERLDELRRLRARLSELDEEVHTRPPPSVAVQLDVARREVKSLRQNLIEAKREQSRLAHQLDLSRSRGGVLSAARTRRASEPPPAGPARES